MTITIDNQLELLSVKHHVPAVKLKAVYFRGVTEFLDTEMTYGSAIMYGLARVQRFINEGGTDIDSDLMSVETPAPVENGMNIDFDSAEYVFDVCYRGGEEVAKLFEPGVTDAIAIDDRKLEVHGHLGNMTWDYSLDLESGEMCFGVL